MNPENGLGSPKTRHVISSAGKLTAFDPTISLSSFPFREVLTALGKVSSQTEQLYIRKRCELYAAGIFAKSVCAEAIVTGEDEEQQAKQTLASLSFVDEVCKLPVLRPLSGMNDEEICQIAKRVGLKTPTTTRPRIQTPKETVNAEQVQALEKELNIYDIIDHASKNIQTIKLGLKK
jgi:thiamine biosynthesis protein ThiI